MTKKTKQTVKKLNNKLQSITFTDFIEYDQDDFDPGEEWKCTRDCVVKNIKKHYPNVAKVSKISTCDGGGLRIYSNDIDTLKKIWFSLSINDAEYDKLVENGELEHMLQATDFYANLS